MDALDPCAGGGSSPWGRCRGDCPWGSWGARSSRRPGPRGRARTRLGRLCRYGRRAPGRGAASGAPWRGPRARSGPREASRASSGPAISRVCEARGRPRGTASPRGSRTQVGSPSHTWFGRAASKSRPSLPVRDGMPVPAVARSAPTAGRAARPRSPARRAGRGLGARRGPAAPRRPRRSQAVGRADVLEQRPVGPAPRAPGPRPPSVIPTRPPPPRPCASSERARHRNARPHALIGPEPRRVAPPRMSAACRRMPRPIESRASSAAGSAGDEPGSTGAAVPGPARFRTRRLGTAPRRPSPSATATIVGPSLAHPLHRLAPCTPRRAPAAVVPRTSLAHPQLRRPRSTPPPVRGRVIESLAARDRQIDDLREQFSATEGRCATLEEWVDKLEGEIGGLVAQRDCLRAEAKGQAESQACAMDEVRRLIEEMRSAKT